MPVVRRKRFKRKYTKRKNKEQVEGDEDGKED